MKDKNKWLIVASILAVVFTVGSIFTALYFRQNSSLFSKATNSNSASQNSSANSNSSTSFSQSSDSNSNQSSSSKNQLPTPLFEGKLTKMDTDLGLILEYKDSPGARNSVYYSAGTIKAGNYAGYQRILVLFNGSQTSQFLTKDMAKFILVNATDIYNTSSLPTSKFAITLAQADPSGDTFDKNKILDVRIFDEELPEIIELDKQLSLSKNQIYLKYPDQRLQEPQSVQKPDLFADFSKLSKLELPNTNYQIWATQLQSSQLPSSDSVLSNYTDSNLETLVVDSTGLAYNYTLTWNQIIQNKPTMEKAYLAQKKVYDEYMQKSYNIRQKIDPINSYTPEIDNEILKQLGKTPTYPEYEYPNTNLKKAYLNSLSGNDFFEKYTTPFPQTCGLQYYTYKNIPDNQLQKVANKDGLEIFGLTNKNHPLYKLEYDIKIKQEYTVDGNTTSNFILTNEGKTKPSYEEYVSKNPLLFFKDTFGRLVGLGEWDYNIGGGCGKPVLYFYPEKETGVNVKFTSQMLLTTDIPRYNESLGWNVLAKPDGKLVDLQPQFTSCQDFDSSHFGREYALEACQKNQYPYIYWAGYRVNGTYPQMNKGWLVAKSDLETFLNQKLDYVGLNNKEKQDMLEYWLPYLQNQNGQYFRLSFLQTSDMNTLAPMQINPQPEKLFRIFLDWQSFDSKPQTAFEPQVLERLENRDGFTVVEWGGLK